VHLAAVQGLREEARQRLLRLMTRTLQWLNAGRVSDTAVLRFLEWLEALRRRQSYLALLLERPPRTSACCACWAPRAGRRAT
jgi:glutamate-ammonia-ligase adenylyltransferase